MEIERNIRIFFARYGRLLLFIIGVIFLIITAIQTANKIVAENIKSRNVILTEEEQKVLLEEKTKEEKEKKVIAKWIEYCRNNQLDEAYSMISEECKEEYKTIEEFNSKIIQKYFSIKVISYKMYQENSIYFIKLQQDFLETGKQNSIITIKIKIQEDILLGKKIDIIN